MNRYPAISLILFLSLAQFFSCSPRGKSTYQKSMALMDTFVTLTVVSDSADSANRAMESAFATIEKFGNLINFFSDTSELSAINRDAGVREVRVSSDTLGVVERAIYISEISGGAFDATIGPEVKLWDFHKKIRPSDAVIRKNIGLVNYRNIVVDHAKSTVFLREKGMLMDLGGIAKGYVADLALAVLRRSGIRAGIIAVAGDIRAFGRRPDGSLWNIGVQNPRQKDKSDEIMAVLKMTDKAVSTSGDYQRYFIEDGRRYHHILDPKTGYPADRCRSVTVVGGNGIYADGFSTAVFVLGPERGMELAEKYGIDAVIVDSSGEVHLTPGVRDIITFK